MAQRFSGKTVLITGASSGIGEASARRFAAEGAHLVLAARRKEKLDALARELGGPAKALAVRTDVGVKKDLIHFLDTAKQQFGRIDVVISNAGYNLRGPVEEIDAKHLTRIVRTNLEAPVLLSKLALPHLREAGGGAIVNVTSIAGKIPLPDEAAYSATKAGLRAFTRALAQELEDSGIQVSMVSPGPVDTGFIMDEIDDVPDMVFAQPMSTADQIAELVVTSAADGKLERTRPRLSGLMATAGYLFPVLTHLMEPLMTRRGRAAKLRYRNRSE